MVPGTKTCLFSVQAGLLDAELAVPRASDGALCDSLQFQMWQVGWRD